MSYPVVHDEVEAYATSEQITNIVRAFEACTLPSSEWTHRTHLTVALYYLAQFPEPEATERIRDGIQRYNQANGIRMTKDGGYHDTITLFWIRMIRSYCEAADKAASLVDWANGVIACYGDKRLPFEYYSRDLLMSWEARTHWVGPDLKLLV